MKILKTYEGAQGLMPLTLYLVLNCAGFPSVSYVSNKLQAAGINRDTFLCAEVNVRDNGAESVTILTCFKSWNEEVVIDIPTLTFKKSKI